MPVDPSGLPETIKVGPYDYKLVRWALHEGSANRAYGQHSSVSLEIRIDFGTTFPAQVANSILHEIMHAVWHAWVLDDKDEQERVVSSMANGLHAVWRDNPAVFAWIAKQLIVHDEGAVSTRRRGKPGLPPPGLVGWTRKKRNL